MFMDIMSWPSLIISQPLQVLYSYKKITNLLKAQITGRLCCDTRSSCVSFKIIFLYMYGFYKKTTTIFCQPLMYRVYTICVVEWGKCAGASVGRRAEGAHVPGGSDQGRGGWAWQTQHRAGAGQYPRWTAGNGLYWCEFTFTNEVDKKDK